jgi:hypothetical protein
MVVAAVFCQFLISPYSTTETARTIVVFQRFERSVAVVRRKTDQPQIVWLKRLERFERDSFTVAIEAQV